MRDRSTQFVLWILGLGISSAWLVLNGGPFALSQKVTVGVAVAFLGFLSIYLVRGIHQGFTTNHRTMVDVEEALGCYDEGAYLESRSLYPKEYQDGPPPATSHFIACYVWIVVVALLVLVLLLTIPPLRPEPGALGSTSTQQITP